MLHLVETLSTESAFKCGCSLSSSVDAVETEEGSDGEVVPETPGLPV